MSYCYLAFRTNVLLNLCCPGHLSYYSPNESEPLLSCELFPTGMLTSPRHNHWYIRCNTTGAYYMQHVICHTYTEVGRGSSATHFDTDLMPFLFVSFCFVLLNLTDEVVCWLLNVPATCQCFSGTDLLRQFYVLQIQLSTSPSHSTLTLGRPVPALTL